MKIYCDGGSRGNPGPAASAFVAYDNDGNVLCKSAKYLGVATNNVAEYTALVMALLWLDEYATEETEIILDSELVKKQMTGEYKIKSDTLRALAMRAKDLENGMKIKVSYTHTLRDGNSEADALVNEKLDDASKHKV